MALGKRLTYVTWFHFELRNLFHANMDKSTYERLTEAREKFSKLKEIPQNSTYHRRLWNKIIKTRLGLKRLDEVAKPRKEPNGRRRKEVPAQDQADRLVGAADR